MSTRLDANQRSVTHIMIMIDDDAHQKLILESVGDRVSVHNMRHSILAENSFKTEFQNID